MGSRLDVLNAPVVRVRCALPPATVRHLQHSQTIPAAATAAAPPLPTGKDLFWYTRGKQDEAQVEQELAAVKAREQDLMMEVGAGVAAVGPMERDGGRPACRSCWLWRHMPWSPAHSLVAAASVLGCRGSSTSAAGPPLHIDPALATRGPALAPLAPCPAAGAGTQA
jgi:hypothetical protein